MKSATSHMKYALLCLALLFAGFSHAAESIASKIETLGELKNISVTSLKVRKQSGLLNIQAEFDNSSVENQPLFYRFKWLDASGFSVWGEEPWKPKTLYGKQKAFINAIAPTPSATDFRIELQTSGNKTPMNASDKDATSIPGHP